MNKFKQLLAASVLLTVTIFNTSCKKESMLVPQQQAVPLFDKEPADSLPIGRTPNAVPLFDKEPADSLPIGRTPNAVPLFDKEPAHTPNALPVPLFNKELGH